MRLILHIGAGKTGTSAIQAALAELRSELGAAGILYPLAHSGAGSNPDDQGVVRGNARFVGDYLNTNKHRDGFNPEDVLAWLRGIIVEAAGRDILMSGESMQFANVKQTDQLIRFFSAAGYETSVIFYVRHLLDHAISGYLQNLKSGNIGAGARGRLRDRNTFFRAGICQFADSLEPYATVLPPQRIFVRLFENERHDLVPRFLALISDHGFPKVDAEKVVNRSPTIAEQVVFTELAQLEGGRRLCRHVASLMLNTPATERTDIAITPEELAIFTRRNKSIVERINNDYLKDNGTLRIKSDKVRIGVDEPAPPEAVYATFARVLARMDGAARAQLRANAIAQRQQGKPA